MFPLKHSVLLIMYMLSRQISMLYPHHLTVGPDVVIQFHRYTNNGIASSYTGACSYVNPYPTHPPYYYHPWAPASLYPGHPGSFTVGSPEIPTNVQSPDVKSRSYSTSMSVASSQLDAPCVDFDSTVGALGLTRNEENEDENDCVRTGNPNVIQVNHHDDDVFTEDPQFVEHQHIQHQSQVRVEDRPLFDRPEGYAMRESPVWDSSGTPHQTSWDGAWGSRNQATRGPRRSIIRTVSRKTTKYKSTCAISLERLSIS